MPISYIVLKLGYQPEAVFVVHFIIIIIAQYIRVTMLRDMINLPFGEYVKKVVFRIVAVVCASIIIPIVLHIYLPANFGSMLLTCLASCLSVLIGVYALGLTPEEKDKINNKLVKFINRNK